MRRILPILFNTEMVRAILDGRKTVTRRICKDGNDYTMPDMDFYDADKRTYAVHNYADKEQMDKLSTAEHICPICPGDILYVRETWCNANKEGAKPDYYYYADTFICEDYDKTEWKWRPSIHMPKAAARIWLKVTDVRVERLLEATNPIKYPHGKDNTILREGFKRTGDFIDCWNSTIKKPDLDKYGWDADPWVWVIEFERCEKPESEG